MQAGSARYVVLSKFINSSITGASQATSNNVRDRPRSAETAPSVGTPRSGDPSIDGRVGIRSWRVAVTGFAQNSLVLPQSKTGVYAPPASALRFHHRAECRACAITLVSLDQSGWAQSSRSECQQEMSSTSRFTLLMLCCLAC